MKVSVEEKSKILRILSVEVPVLEVNKAFDKALGSVSKKAVIPGFRKGKAPMDLIKKQFNDEIKKEAIKQVIDTTYSNALGQVEKKPISEPEVAPDGEIENGKPFKYKIYFEIYPEFTVQDYEGLKLEKEDFEVTEGDVENELHVIQERMTQLEPSPDGKVGPGMVAMVDFEGTADGKTFEGSSAKDYVIDMDASNMLKDFEKGMMDMKVSEERDISFKYPEDYFKKEMMGKQGLFRVKVKDLKKKIVPELTDDFAKELGSYANLEEVKKDIKAKIGEYKNMLARRSLKEQAISQLIEKHKDLEVPLTLVQSEFNNILEQINQQLKHQGKTLKDIKIEPNEFVAKYRGEAEKRARGFMLVNAITKQEKIEVSEDDLNGRVALIAANTRSTPEKVRAQLEKEGRINHLRAEMIFEKTLDFVVDKAKISTAKSKNKKK